MTAEVPPPPQPPREPALEECCGTGCTPCIFDLYEEALARYRAEQADWEAKYGVTSAGRNDPASPGAPTSGA